jgi:hypothetical protein
MSDDVPVITSYEGSKKTPEEFKAEGYEAAKMTPEVAKEIFLAGMKYAMQSMLKNDVLIYDKNKGYGSLAKHGVDIEDWPTIFWLINIPGSNNLMEPAVSEDKTTTDLSIPDS